MKGFLRFTDDAVGEFYIRASALESFYGLRDAGGRCFGSKILVGVSGYYQTVRETPEEIKRMLEACEAER